MITRYPNGLSPTNRGYVNKSNEAQGTNYLFNERWIAIPLSATDGTTTFTTNFTIPANMVILPNPFVYVRTAEATGGTKTLSVGVTGTTGAFLTGLSVSTTGIKQGVMGDVAGVTLGSFLYEFTATTTTGYARLPYVVGTAIALTWTPGSNDWVEFRGTLLLPVLQGLDMTNLPVNADIANIDIGL